MPRQEAIDIILAICIAALLFDTITKYVDGQKTFVEQALEAVGVPMTRHRVSKEQYSIPMYWDVVDADYKQPEKPKGLPEYTQSVPPNLTYPAFERGGIPNAVPMAQPRAVAARGGGVFLTDAAKSEKKTLDVPNADWTSYSM